MSAKKKQKKKVKNRGRTAPPYPFEFRLRVVRLYLEDGYDASMIAQECGISAFSVYRWSKAYREQGEAGLRIKPRAAQPTKMPENVRGKIIDIKQNNPGFGARRIADILKRFFLIPTNASSVHRTLTQEGLGAKKKSKATKNPKKPRFFERASANQMWQSDIMTFRLAGRNAYLIGFMDDYSRYITGLGFYRSQTAEQVLETYRRAISEYGVPREVLTDNGRQYTNWRGTTRFERELQKDRVKHIKSRPHHPMTLGKIERFWQTILGEFLQRAQFANFEEAVERTAFWVKYYNYKRPNQGIGGLCPADRFFEIQHELKKTLEQGIEENALELALRGKPRDPFYMVGRMGDQSVVIRAEKGKVKMLVDGADPSGEKELVYDAGKDIDHEKDHSTQLRSAGQDHGRAVGMDRTAHDIADVQRDVGQRSAVESVAEPGHGGPGHGPEPEETGENNAQSPSDPADRKDTAGSDRQAGKTAEGGTESCESQPIVALDINHGSIPSSPEKSRGHHEGALRVDDGITGSTAAGGIAKDLLPVGATGLGRAFGRSIREAGRPTGEGKTRGSVVGEAACRNPPGKRNTSAEADFKGPGL
jgi:transposase InsO family protein/transposase-like protein